MSFPTLAGTTSGDTPAAATRTLTLPGSIAAGNLLLAIMAEGQTMSHTWPAGWTELFDTSGYSVASRVADGSEGASIDVTTSSSARGGAYMVHRFSGGNFAVPQLANASFSNTAAADPPNLAPSWTQTDVVWLAVAACNNSSGSCGGVFPTNYSDNQQTYANSGGGLNGVINFCSRNLNAASENPGAYPVLGAGGRAFTIAISFEPIILTASAGSYSQTGTAATPKSARKAVAGAATYDQTVQPVTLKSARVAAAAAGSYAQTGQASVLAKGNKVAADAGSYDHAGASASLKRGAKLAAAADTYSLTGSSAELVWFDAGSFGISAEAGAYTQTGTDATPKSGRKIAAGTAAYAMSGQSAGTLVTRKIAAAAGSYDWSGATVTLRHSIGMATDVGPYSHVGSLASTVYGAYLIGDVAHYRWNSPDDASLIATLIRSYVPEVTRQKPASRFNDKRFDEGGSRGGSLRK